MTILKMPKYLKSSRNLNLSPKTDIEFNPFKNTDLAFQMKKEFYSENKNILPLINMSSTSVMPNANSIPATTISTNSTPVAVLPTGDVLTNTGKVVSGAVVANSSSAANSTATTVGKLPGGNSVLSNGNSVNTQSMNHVDITPSHIVQGHVVMSNGNTVAPHNVAVLPHSPSNGSNSKSGMNSYQQSPSDCPIDSTPQQTKYCRPAPFHSTNGEKYFYVGEAYGTSVAQ